MPPTPPESDLAALDHAHVWHPFTPMRQWRGAPPLVIERGEGDFLIDTAGNRYIDGVSSLWCNVHGHRVPAIDRAVRDQLDRIAHTTLLGLASPPSIHLAARLCRIAPGGPDSTHPIDPPALNKVFYSDAGATAVEVAFKMAVGYWHQRGQPGKCRFIGIAGAYHGDTTGSMSVGYSDLFHRPFRSMVFETRWAPTPDCCRPPQGVPNDLRQAAAAGDYWPSEHPELTAAVRDACLAKLEQLLQQHADETAAVVVEPLMQGAAGMICQPPGYLRGVADLARQYDTLLIADEVATGFGRTGAMFACEHEQVVPDLMCLAKGITGGYLPLAATLATDAIEQAFCGELEERKTLYHGHTYTGNPLAAAAALASLDLFEQNNLLDHINAGAAIIRDRLSALRDAAHFPHVIDIRRRGLMVGIELARDRHTAKPFDFAAQQGARLCAAMRSKGLIIRPLGNVLILMPICAMQHETLHRMLDIVIETLEEGI